MNGTDQKGRVFLLTGRFPYGIVETFIEAELSSLPEDVELTIFPTQIRSSRGEHRQVPDGVRTEVLLEGNARLLYPLLSLRMLFSKAFWHEVGRRRRMGILKASDLYHVAGFFGRAAEIARTLEKKHGRELKEGAVLYSYWFTTAAFAASMLHEKYGVKAVSRAHGTDVYDGRCVYGSMPGQGDALKGLDALYVCSENGMRYLQRKYPEAADRIGCAYLGSVDYGPGPEGGDGPFVLCSCSRLIPLKRVHRIAAALQRIQDVPICWVHMGDGGERAGVEEAVKGLPANVQAVLLGDLAHDDVMAYYREHRVDLFVNVSESEGLPVSIMEALSFGIPVLATDVGGTGEIVSEGAGELMPRDFEPEELARRIESYVRMDPAAYREKRRAARQRWEAHFWAAENYKKFYEEILR